MSSPETSQVPPFIITVSSRALFDLEDSHQLYEKEGVEAYERHQLEHENDMLSPGPAYGLVRKLLAVNDKLPEGVPKFEVILLSRNSPQTCLRVFNTIEKMGLPIYRAVFTSGASTAQYIDALGAKLFLSSNPVEVRKALATGVAAATVLPTKAKSGYEDQIRIAFDGDAVLFSDQAERIHKDGGLNAFHHHEVSKALEPLPAGPFRGMLEAIHNLQVAFAPGEPCPVRTALITARSAPAHKRTILTLRDWGVRLDEAMFLGGRNKAKFLKAFGADLFFDDSTQNIDMAKDYVASAHVPSGVRNEEGADESNFTGGSGAVAPAATPGVMVTSPEAVEDTPAPSPVRARPKP